MDRIKVERAIIGLTEWQKHVQTNSDIDRDISTAIEALKAQLSKEGTTSDLISKTETVERLRGVLDVTVPITDYDGGYVDGVEVGISTISTMPTIQPVATDTNVGDTISKFIDGLEEIFAHIREREGGDSVCGLCEYDGAYMGQSGDWCNECPGFDMDDCFKLSSLIRKEWTEEILKALPHAQPELNLKNLVRMIEFGITATNSNDAYSLGMRNGMRWCKSLIDGAEPKFEDGVTRVGDGADSAELPPAQPERKKGEWSDGYRWQRCSLCKQTGKKSWNYCPNCGAKMKGGSNE